MKYLKFLIPVLAIIVILEAVLLVSNLQMAKKVVTNGSNNAAQVDQNPVAGELIAVEVMAESNEFMVNKKNPVKVVMRAEKAMSLDSVNLFVKYDPKAFVLSELVSNEAIAKPVFEKISTEKGLVVVNYMIAGSGFTVKAGEEIELASFVATGKSVGDYTFEISTGAEAKESATMFVDTDSSKAVPYSSSALTVTVSK